LDIIAETYATYLLSDADGAVKPSNEVVGGIKVFVERNSYFMLGGGIRTTNGFEAADQRAIVGFIFEPSIGDRDGDGYKDDVDKCPDEPEDFDGFQDADGCPDPDNDQDGILDVDDLCPNEPEDFDGFEDHDGCPDPDNDHDRIPDKDDKCPNQPETYNGYQDADGCPDHGPAVARVEGGIITLQPINFEYDKAVIKPDSYYILDAVVATMNGYPDIELIEVQGHTDERGDDDYNLDLSRRRAAAVEA
ncbi:MAG TPA: OmpA family protein, partial [Vicinamibacterales bacterium]|nr:OmpA family protein [Vicinamibacterales bacterium]